jgi:predicted MPP superfamily phosphohydrolase
MLRMVHLSDIHLNGRTLKDFDEFIIKALVADLISYNKSHKIDIIVFSGDLIDKGGDGFDDISSAFIAFEEKVIEPIKIALDLPKDSIIIAPGNHDINRNADELIEELGLKALLKSTMEVNKFIDENKTNGINRIFVFKDFEQSLYDNLTNYEFSNYQSSFMLNLLEHKIGITCFNSAWRCYDSTYDKSNIILGERQVTNSLKWIEDCDIKIAILHHPLDWLIDFDYKAVSPFISNNYDIVLCGHAHESDAWAKSDNYGSLFVSVAPCNWTYNIRSTDRISCNGYSIIDYDPDKMTVEMHNRRYAHAKLCFDPNTDRGDAQGKVVFRLPDNGMLSKQAFELQISEKITDLHFDDINEHLISYSPDTKAPKNLNDLFVLPLIVSKVEYDAEKLKDETDYSLEMICSANDNFLLIGPKESGKTILLDKLLTEFASKIRNYRKIPVYIDFEEVGHRRFESIINHYLGGIGIKKIKEFLNEYNIVLLIDNLSFDKNQSTHKINKLDKLLMDYRNVKVIATCNTLFEGKIPLEIMDCPTFTTFKPLFIKGFRTSQIRELVNNWFYGSNFLDTPGKLDKLIKSFIRFNLPRTPLAISLFLWIIEQQENYKPINHATMLEHYIETLFKKLSKGEIYSSQFDYKNKERLLTDIAFFMYQTNLDNYRVKTIELITFINRYIELRKFEYEAETLLEYFLSKGILIKENDGYESFIRFRFTCFFEYFLMKKMDYDPDFKNYVLMEDNYLSFTNEIDYYTGIKRDESEILSLIIERMNKEYSELNTVFSQNKDNIDIFFKTKESIINDLDDSFIEKLTKTEKPDDKIKDNITDNMLDKIKPEAEIEKKERKFTPFKRMELLWTLSAQVLKNTEETEIENLKGDSYNCIIQCSIAYTIIHRMLLDNFIKNKTARKTKVAENVLLLWKFLPLATEFVLYYLMGTKKLNVVIKEKIEKDHDSPVSEFEKFLSVFLYSDLKGTDNLKYIDRFIKSIKASYIYDMSLIKLMGYYFIRSKTKESDKKYEDLLAKLVMQSKKLKKTQRGKVLEAYREKRKKSDIDKDELSWAE